MIGKEGKSKSKNNKKKRARSEDENADGEATAAGVSKLDGVAESDDERAARVYQAWLEARYFDFLRVLLGWIAEVDDFHRQVIDSRRALAYECVGGHIPNPSSRCVFLPPAPTAAGEKAGHVARQHPLLPGKANMCRAR